MNIMFPEDLINFYNQNKGFTAPVYDSFSESNNDHDCCYYPIKFDFDADLLLKECLSVDDLFFDHRSQDKTGSYGHRGWKSLTLHGIDKHKTEHFTKYGFTSLDEAKYHWTDICDKVPNLAEFLKSLPYNKFDRVRIMKLEAGGFIMPHSDNKYQRAFSPLNIAINNPEGCCFVFKDKGIVPFTPRLGMILDVGREHMVINQSNEARYHIIVHGHYSKKFYKL